MSPSPDSPPPPAVLICHSGRQHSDQLAAALHRGGFAVTHLHGAAIRPSLRSELAGIGHRLLITWGLSRLLVRLLPAALGRQVDRCYHALCDRRFARVLQRGRFDAVIGYEMSSARLFAAARQRGIVAILDAADVHYRVQDEPPTALRRAINAVKDRELRHADHVLTCSTLARSSYIAAGRHPDTVTALPLGVDPTAFAYRTQPPASGALKLLFVGRFSRKKGADTLADALAAMAVPVETVVIADPAVDDAGLAAGLGAHARLAGRIAPGELAAYYSAADLLVVPSRFDSYALVVPEALACGLPVAASTMVGAGDLLEDGVSGFHFPPADPEALAALLTELAVNPARVRAMRPAAHAAAARADWPLYHRRAAAAVRALLAPRHGSA